MTDTQGSGYDDFLSSVRDTVSAVKSGHAPPELEDPDGGAGERGEPGSTRRGDPVTTVLLGEILDQLKTVSERLDSVERITRADVVQLLRERSAELEVSLQHATDITPRLDGLGEELTEQLAGLEAKLRALVDQRMQAVTTALAGHLDSRIEAVGEATTAAQGHLVAQLRAALDEDLRSPLLKRTGGMARQLMQLVEALDPAGEGFGGRLVAQEGERQAEVAARQAEVAGLRADLAEQVGGLRADLAVQVADSIQRATAEMQVSLRSRESERDQQIASVDTKADELAHQLSALSVHMSAATAETARGIDQLREWLGDAALSPLTEVVQTGLASVQRQTKALAEATSSALNTLQTGVTEANAAETAGLRTGLQELTAAQQDATQATQERANQQTEQLRRVLESLGGLASNLEELRGGAVEVSTTLRDVGSALMSTRVQLEGVTAAQTHAAEVHERILGGQSEMRAVVDLQQVRSVRPSDLQQLMTEIGAVAGDLTRQGSSWQRFDDQLAAIAARLEAIEGQLAPAPGEQPTTPPA